MASAPTACGVFLGPVQLCPAVVLQAASGLLVRLPPRLIYTALRLAGDETPPTANPWRSASAGQQSRGEKQITSMILVNTTVAKTP